MSLKKLCCMFAVVVFIMLFSMTAASACSHDHSAVGSGKHAGETNHRVKASTISSNLIGEQKQVALKDHSAKTLKSPIRASVAMTPVQDDGEDGEVAVSMGAAVPAQATSRTQEGVAQAVIVTHILALFAHGHRERHKLLVNQIGGASGVVNHT